MRLRDQRQAIKIGLPMAALLILVWAARVSAELSADQEGWVQDRLDDGDLVGLIVVSVSDGSIHHKAFGRTSIDDSRELVPSDQFEIGSITKAFTNLLLAELVAKGSVSYDTTIAAVLTDQEFDNPDVGRITLLELATHTSGLPRLPSNLAPEDQSDPYVEYDVAALQAGVRSARAGQRLVKTYAYSNFGVGLLGYLLGMVDGSGYEKALAAHVLQPLGMQAATFEDGESLVPGHHAGVQVPHWHMNALSGAGGLRSSGNELALVVQPWLSGESGGLQHDVSADIEIAAAAGGNMNVTRVWHTAGEGKQRVFWHNGGTGGFRTFVGFNPVTGEGRVVLSNTDYDVTAFGLDLLGASLIPAKAATFNEMEINRDTLRDYVGKYELAPGAVFVVSVSGSQLMVRLAKQQKFPVFPFAPDRFFYKVVDAQLTFNREDGEVVSLTLHQNGANQLAQKQ